MNMKSSMYTWVSGPFESLSSFLMRWLEIDCDEYIEKVTFVCGSYLPNRSYNVFTRPLSDRPADFVIMHRRRMYFFYFPVSSF